MLLNLLSHPVSFVFYLIAVFVAITVHEFAHAITADRLGAPTPSLQGRVSLHPVKHIDLYGLIFLFLTGFGWGRPVQFDPYNLHNPRKDAAIISIAGPVSNFILAIISSIALRLAFSIPALSPISSAIALICVPMIVLNVSLGIFNLIPVHPLDGFKIVGGLLPDEQADEWYSLERYGFIILILLILPIIGGQSMIGTFIRPITNFVISFLMAQPSGMM